jgi:hypothetical protein
VGGEKTCSMNSSDSKSNQESKLSCEEGAQPIRSRKLPIRPHRDRFSLSFLERVSLPRMTHHLELSLRRN